MANYLYNGVELPDINTVWTDKETYPYAFTTKYNDLILSSEPFVAKGTWTTNTGPVLVYDYIYTNGKWAVGWGELEFTSGGSYTPAMPIWANYDVLNEDGSVYLSATTPISLANQTVIEWDGDTTDLQSTTRSYTYEDGTVVTNTYYKVSDVVPSKRQALGGYSVIDFSGTLSTAQNADVMEKADGDICADVGFLVREDGVWLLKVERSTGTDYTNLFTYLTVALDLDPVAFMTGYQLGILIRDKLNPT